MIVTAATPIGVLYGAYTFLEQLGIGFYLGGDAFPGHNLPLEVPASLDVRQKPVFAVRGSLPWYNFLNSPTTWDLDDFKYFFDQMAKMKSNFVGFHTYDSEPFAPYADAQGRLVYAEPLVTSLNYGWGAVRGMAHGQFGFGTGDYFDQELFGSRATTQSQEPRRRHPPSPGASWPAVWTTASGAACGCASASRSAAIPRGPSRRPPWKPGSASCCGRIPMLDYVWLWQSEGRGGGADIPAAGLAAGRPRADPAPAVRVPQGPAADRRSGPRERVHSAGACDSRRLAPQMRLIVSGWGGDRVDAVQRLLRRLRQDAAAGRDLRRAG